MSHTFHRYRIGDEPVAGYRLTDHLGAGGFGEVWKANAPGGTEVALKIIDLTGQQGVQEFTSLRVVKKVRHPNLISLQAFWMKDEAGQIVDEVGQASAGAPNANVPNPAADSSIDPKRQTQSGGIAATAFFVKPVELIIAMQLGSMSLHKRLEDCREQGLPGIPVAELLEYLEQAARGIDFLNKPIHDLGKGPVPIVHGDVKPHNILVVGDAAVVCDFGLARAVETLRKTSMAPVTVAYAAPESFKGKVTPTSDQYSLAITYAELRTGRLPFDETMTPYQVMEAHVTRNLDFTRLPDPERAVVVRATESDPDARWPSSRDMILALRRAVAETGELPLRPGEAAYTGGPTPTHSITARPKTRDTDLPTRYPVDPHKETMHPGGHTPSEVFSLQTDVSPRVPARPGDSLAETAMHAPMVPAPAKKSKVGLIVAIAAAIVVLAGIVIVPKLLEKTAASSVGAGNVAGGKGVEANEPPSSDPNVQYIRIVQGKINNGDFNLAIQELNKAPSALPPFEKEALQKRLKEAFLKSIDSRVQSQSFERAFDDLNDAKSGIGLTDADKKEAGEKIRTAWLAQANDELANDQAAASADTASSLLKRFAGDRDGQIMLARAHLRMRDLPAVKADLEKVGAASKLPPEYQPLVSALALLADGSAAKSPEDWSKLVDGFMSFANLEKSAPPPANLALNSYEREQMALLRGKLTDNLRPILDTLPADQRKALVDKLEQIGGNAELQMVKVRTALEEKHFDEARSLLAAAAAKLPADAADLKAQADAMAALIALRDPATKAEAAVKAIGDATKLLASLTPMMRSDLSAAASAFALNSSPAALPAAIEMVSRTRDLDPGEAATIQLAHLLSAQIALRAADQKPPTKEELPKLIQDCELIEQPGLSNGTVDAFHAECLLAQDSRDRQTLLSLVEHAKPVDGYTQLVQARVWRTLPQPDWTKIAEAVRTAYAGEPSKYPPILVAQFRRASAAKLLIEAAARKRNPAPSTAASVLGNPFPDAAAADAAFQWLQLAAALTGDIETLDLKGNKRDLWVNLALAAAWKPKPADQIAHNQSTRLAEHPDANLDGDFYPILLVAFKNRGASPADQWPAIQSAQGIVEQFQKQFPVADPQALTIYNEVLKPAIDLADAQANSKSPHAGLDKFYAVAADFINHYQQAKWPFPDKQREIEKLLTAAIKLNPKVPKHFTSRGVARISQVPPNIEGALADAADAKKLDANLPAAYALEGHGLIYRSRQEPTRESRLADLAQALASCKAAVDKSKAGDDQRAMHLLYLSMALLEKANCDNDPKVKKELLDQSVVYAQQAVELEKDKAYPDYAWTALANALEDVAWIVGEDPEKNYLAAIDAFGNAIASNPSAPDPLIGRARCYYKAIADSKLDPKFLGRTSEEAMQSAIADLQQAKLLRPDFVEPNLWIGKANQQLGKFAEADDALAEAVKLAEAQKLPEQALYLVEWTRNAAMNSALVADERGNTVRERAKKLKTAPSLGGSSNVKQAALLIGDSLLAEKKTADAIKEYDAGLSEIDKADATKPLDPNKSDGSDASLLLSREAAAASACRMRIGIKLRSTV